MNDLPSQKELDAVGHFVEAVRELRRSPFFVEEYSSLRISMREGDPKENIKGHFPDPNILQGMLVPFRRVWQQNEPCHHMKVAKILKKHVPDFRCFLDSVVFNDERTVVRNMPWFRDVVLSLTDVINVWLNTRYLHIGKSSRHGRFTREDFDNLNSQIGPVLFEFYFLSAVHEAGISFFNILQCAESFFRGFTKQGLTPSFPIRSVYEDGNVERKTIGYTPDEDTPSKRVWRLRRRRHYDGFNHFLDLIGCTDASVASLLTLSDSFDNFVKRSGIVLERTDDLRSLDKEDFTHFEGCIDNYPTVLRNRRCRRGFVVKRRDGTLVWEEEYVPVLRDQYTEFREAFSKEQFR